MIGVVLAVKNQEQFVGEALDSIAAQSLPAQEVILVNNGSTDGTGDVARAKGVRVIDSPGPGPEVARNIGARLITAEYICFLDGDDRYTPDHNQLLLDAIGERDAVGGHVREFYDPGREQELSGRFAISEEPTTGSVCALLIRRTAFERLGGFSERPDEHDFFGFMSALGKVPAIDDVVLERRIHGENRSIVDRAEIHTAYLRSARAAIMARRRQQQQ